MAKFAFYKGTDKPFNKLVSWKMEGPYSHCEAVFEFDPETGLYLCASSSFMDRGIRFKDIGLNPAKWDIIDVPGIDGDDVKSWFMDHLFYVDANGQWRRTPYDVRGLVSFLIPVGHTPEGYFCDEALGAAIGLVEPHRFEPNGLACILERLGGKWIQGGPAWAQNDAMAQAA